MQHRRRQHIFQAAKRAFNSAAKAVAARSGKTGTHQLASGR